MVKKDQKVQNHRFTHGYPWMILMNPFNLFNPKAGCLEFQGFQIHRIPWLMLVLLPPISWQSTTCLFEWRKKDS